MALTSSEPSAAFVRDRFTWLAYFMLGYYAYLQSSLGPMMPFLRDELNMNYTVTGLHISGFALGMMLAGIYGPQLAARWGRYLVFWLGSGGMALSAALFALVHHPSLTILSTFLMGFLGSFLLVMIQASLADHHQEKRAIPLTESNILASVFATLAPIIVGQGVGTLLGWRLAIWIGVIYCIIVFVITRDIEIPGKRIQKTQRKMQSKQVLPRAFWVYWAVVFVSVSIEWSLIFWSADFLLNSVGLAKETASTLVGVFLGAMIVGRLIGSRLTHILSIANLLLGAISAVAIGFPLFWLAQVPALNILGLFIAGLGIANLFPLTLSAATSTAPEQIDKASARVSLAAGTAILIAPQILGTIADQTSIHFAFGIVVILIIVDFVAFGFARRLSTQVN